MFAASTVVVLIMVTFVLMPPAVFRDRSFFGLVQVFRLDDGNLTVLMHGTTPHGRQWSDAARRHEPGSYYARTGPMGDVFAQLDAHAPMDVRVVGLGAGSLAAYERPGDDFRFYEIDPLIARVAEDPALFTFLQDAQGSTSIRIGDGRLLVADDPDASADLVILDAFTSDAVPVHLITAEGLADVARTLRPGGIVAVHVSNRYYDLEPPVAAGLEAAGLDVVRRIYTPTAAESEDGASTSHWLVAGRPGESDALLAGAHGARLVIAPHRRTAHRRLRRPVAVPAAALVAKPEPEPERAWHSRTRVAYPGIVRRTPDLERPEDRIDRYSAAIGRPSGVGRTKPCATTGKGAWQARSAPNRDQPGVMVRPRARGASIYVPGVAGSRSGAVAGPRGGP